MLSKNTVAGLVLMAVTAMGGGSLLMAKPNSPEEVTKTIQLESIHYFTANDVDCLALNIYFEARNQPHVGAVAVGHVVLNRKASKRYPNTVCKVVKQGRHYRSGQPVKNRCQFSWWCDGKSDHPKDRTAWKAARVLAFAILRNQIDDPTEGALWYHATYVKPYWTASYAKVGQFGDHIFYEVSK